MENQNEIILVISIHSFIDVITNSSSELFICNTDKSVNMIEGYIRREIQKCKDEDGCWKYDKPYNNNMMSGNAGEYEVQTLKTMIDEDSCNVEYLERNGIKKTDGNFLIEYLKLQFSENEEVYKLLNDKIVFVRIDKDLCGIITGLKRIFNAQDVSDFLKLDALL